MKMMKAIVAFLTLTACAGVGPVNTPSGNPEVTIKSTNTNRIKSALVTLYSGNGYSLASDSQFNLVFAKQLNPGEAALQPFCAGDVFLPEKAIRPATRPPWLIELARRKYWQDRLPKRAQET